MAALAGVARMRLPYEHLQEVRPLFSVPQAEGAQRTLRRSLAVAAGTLPALALFGGPASAAVTPSEPPTPGPPVHQIISFPERDFVSATGYKQGVAAIVTIKRYNTATKKLDVIAKSEPTLPQDDPDTTEFDGLVEINHPGGGCWTTITPDIRAGDKVQVTQGTGASAVSDDTTTTAYVKAGKPAQLNANTVVIHGTAQSMTTTSGQSLAKQIPNAQIEQ